MVVDIIAALIMLASIGISILRGFIREVLTIFGLVGGAIAAYVGGPLLMPVMKDWFGIVEGDEDPEKFFGVVPYPLLSDIISYAVIFIIFVILFSVISHFLAESVKKLGLGAVDRTLGMVFGIARGVLFLGLLYLPIYYLVDDKQMEEWDWLKTSKSRIYLEATSKWIATYIPTNESAGDNASNSDSGVSVMNEARKKLEEMNLLQKDSSTPVNDNHRNSEGYSDEFRSKMDKLIEEATSGDDGVDKPQPQYNE